MGQSGAERQRAYRDRRASRLAALEYANARLEAEVAALSAALEGANAEIERLSGAACKHPQGAVEGGTCRACGADIW